MQRSSVQLGRVRLAAAALAGAALLGGCGMTARDQFFQARSVTFKAMPGNPDSGASGLAARTGTSDLAAAYGASR